MSDLMVAKRARTTCLGYGCSFSAGFVLWYANFFSIMVVAGLAMHALWPMVSLSLGWSIPSFYFIKVSRGMSTKPVPGVHPRQRIRHVDVEKLGEAQLLGFAAEMSALQIVHSKPSDLAGTRLDEQLLWHALTHICRCAMT